MSIYVDIARNWKVFRPIGHWGRSCWILHDIRIARVEGIRRQRSTIKLEGVGSWGYIIISYYFRFSIRGKRHDMSFLNPAESIYVYFLWTKRKQGTCAIGTCMCRRTWSFLKVFESECTSENARHDWPLSSQGFFLWCPKILNPQA